MIIRKTNIILLFIIFGLVNITLVGCSGVPSQPAPVFTITTTPTQKEAQPTQTRIVVTPTPTSTLVRPSATPTATATNTPAPTPAPVSVVKEENGWVTYRNEVIGYEISAPKDYVIKGESPQVGDFRGHLLGPAVPDEEIQNLISRYYGNSLYVWIYEPNNTGLWDPWSIAISAYDIIVNDLGGNVSPGGIGDNPLTSRQETLQIDWQPYPVRFTVELKDNQPVRELAVLYLEKDGVNFMFGYVQPKDDPEAYQTYLKEVWPEIRKIIETYKKLPEKTSLGDNPSVYASGLKDASPQAISKALFEQYLTAFQENPLDPLIKLSAYRIDEVEISAKWQACAELNKAEYIATITYSVKPEHWPPEKWTEDGYLTFDQWITRKKASIAVFRSGQDYTMKILDNPICPGF